MPFEHGRGELYHGWLLVCLQACQFRLEGAPAMLGGPQRRIERRKVPSGNSPRLLGNLQVHLGEGVRLGVLSGSGRSRLSPLNELAL